MSSLIDIVLNWVHELFGGAKVSDLSDLGADPHQVVDGAGANPMEAQLKALNASDSIYASVEESQQHLLDSNAAHEAIMGADKADIYADSVSKGAETAIDQAEEATGTSS